MTYHITESGNRLSVFKGVDPVPVPLNIHGMPCWALTSSHRENSWHLNDRVKLTARVDELNILDAKPAETNAADVHTQMAAMNMVNDELLKAYNALKDAYDKLYLATGQIIKDNEQQSLELAALKQDSVHQSKMLDTINETITNLLKDRQRGQDTEKVVDFLIDWCRDEADKPGESGHFDFISKLDDVLGSCSVDSHYDKD